jgi:hypothetical protein
LLLALLVAAASGHDQPPAGDPLGPAIAAQERHTDLLSTPGVVGTAVGLTERGAPAVKIYTEHAGVAGLPRKLDGVPVVVQVTGKLSALHHKTGHDKGGGNGGAEDPPPPPPPGPGAVPIGVSTGNEGECSAGTIGARVKDAAGNVYALSNNHIYALENSAADESDVLSPGLFDTGCAFDPNNVIGTLFAFEPIVFSTSANNTIDAAIALSSTANLGNATPPDGYGWPKSTTVSAAVGQAVQKYGRTSSLTTATITAISATVNVGYDSGTARFVNQIIVESSKKPFIKAGDSGSVAVTDPGRNPVALLFAGNTSGKLAVANDIATVLAHFDVSVDGE